MLDEPEVVIPYKGYLLIQLGSGGCDLIHRPDGTWRYSHPTRVGEMTIAWAYAKRSISGRLEVLGKTLTYDEARHTVDELVRRTTHQTNDRLFEEYP